MQPRSEQQTIDLTSEALPTAQYQVPLQTFEEADTLLWDSEDDLGDEEAVMIRSNSGNLTQVMRKDREHLRIWR